MSVRQDSAASGAAIAVPAYRDPVTLGTTLTPLLRRIDPARDLREAALLMRLPAFALAPGRTQDFHYTAWIKGSGQRVSVGTGPDGGGHATVSDADALVPLISALNLLRNDGARVLPHSLELQPNAVLRVLGRSCGGRQVNLLAGAYTRLAATTIVLDVGHGTRFLNLVERFERPTAGQRGPWRLDLSAGLIAEIAAGRVLKVDPVALRRIGLERRLYSLVRACAGNRDEPWRIDFGTLARLCAWQGPGRRFRQRVADVVANQLVPGFRLRLDVVDGRLFFSAERLATSHAPRRAYVAREAAPEPTLVSLDAFDPDALESTAAEPVYLDFVDCGLDLLEEPIEVWL